MTKSLSADQLQEWDTKYCIVRPNEDGNFARNGLENSQQFRIFSNSVIPIQAIARGYLCRRQYASEKPERISPPITIQVAEPVNELDRKYSPRYNNTQTLEMYSRVATKIQASFRGYLLRSTLDPIAILQARRLEEMKAKYAVCDPLTSTFAEYQRYRMYFNASIVIQALLRGYYVRWGTRIGKILRAAKFYVVLNSVIAEFNAVEDLSTLPFDEYQGFKVYTNAAVAIQSVIRGHSAREHPFGYLPFKLPPSPRASLDQNMALKPSTSLLPLSLSLSRSLTKGATFYLKNEEDSDDEDEREIAAAVDNSSGVAPKVFSLPCSLTVMSLYGATRGRHYDPEAATSNPSNASSGSGRFDNKRMPSGRQSSEFSDAGEADIMDANDDQFWDCFESDADSDASEEEETNEEKEKKMAEELKKIEEIMAFNFELSMQNEREVEFTGEIVDDGGAQFSDDDEDTTADSTTMNDDEFDLSSSFSGNNRPLMSPINSDSSSNSGNKVRTLAKTRSAIERDKARGLSRTDSKIFRKGVTNNPPAMSKEPSKRVAFKDDSGLAAINEDEDEEDSDINDEDIKVLAPIYAGTIEESGKEIADGAAEMAACEAVTETVSATQNTAFVTEQVVVVEEEAVVEAIQQPEQTLISVLEVTEDVPVDTATADMDVVPSLDVSIDGDAAEGSLAMNPRSDVPGVSDNAVPVDVQVTDAVALETEDALPLLDDELDNTGSDKEGFYSGRDSNEQDPLEDLRRSVIEKKASMNRLHADPTQYLYDEELPVLAEFNEDIGEAMQPYETTANDVDYEETHFSGFMEEDQSSIVPQNRGCINAVAELIFTGNWISQLTSPYDDSEPATDFPLSVERKRLTADRPSSNQHSSSATAFGDVSDSGTDVAASLQSPFICGALLNDLMNSPERVCDRDSKTRVHRRKDDVRDDNIYDNDQNTEGDEHSEGDPEEDDRQWYDVILKSPLTNFRL